MGNINKKHYNQQYKTEIELKYKTNTRYLLSLTDKLLKKIECKKIKGVLDVGCGSGIITAELAHRLKKADVKGVDLSEVGINHAKEKYSHVTNLSFYCNNAVTLTKDIELNEANINLITLFELLEHIEDWKRMLSGLLNTYAPEYVIISSPVGRMRDYEKNVGHYRNFKRGEIEYFMKKQGYAALDCYYAGFPFWSPICRDLLNIFKKNAVNVQESNGKGMSGMDKAVSVILYYLFRYCSCLRKGDQFIGVFKVTSDEKRKKQGK